jgi:hypothetical protein
MKFLLLATLLATATSCGGTDSSSSSGDSGIKGRVMIGPVCPAPQPDTPCPNEPYEAELQIVRASTSEVATVVRSDSDGRFSVALPPGRYVIRSADGETSIPSLAPVPVTVPDDEFVQARVIFDSGIRSSSDARLLALSSPVHQWRLLGRLSAATRAAIGPRP